MRVGDVEMGLASSCVIERESVGARECLPAEIQWELTLCTFNSGGEDRLSQGTLSAFGTNRMPPKCSVMESMPNHTGSRPISPITLGAAACGDLLEQPSGVDYRLESRIEFRLGNTRRGLGLHLDQGVQGRRDRRE